MAKKTGKTAELGWRVDVDTADNDEDFTIAVSDEDAALQLIADAFKLGYVTHDRRTDTTVYEADVIPINRIRRFRIYEKE